MARVLSDTRMEDSNMCVRLIDSAIIVATVLCVVIPPFHFHLSRALGMGIHDALLAVDNNALYYTLPSVGPLFLLIAALVRRRRGAKRRVRVCRATIIVPAVGFCSFLVLQMVLHGIALRSGASVATDRILHKTDHAAVANDCALLIARFEADADDAWQQGETREITDALLPRAIRDLRPRRVEVRDEQVRINVYGFQENTLGLNFEPERDNPELWGLWYFVGTQHYHTKLVSGIRIPDSG